MRNLAICLAILALLPSAGAAEEKTSWKAVPSASSYPAGEFDAARAQRNYEALMRGHKTLDELTEQELREVQELDQLARSGGGLRLDTRSPRQRCLDDEIEHAGGSPSRLEMRVIGLKCSQH